VHDILKKVLSAPKPRAPTAVSPPGGLTHFIREHDGRAVRYHLRIEPDGSGLLLANATAALRLSPTGVVIAHGLLDGRATDDALVRRVVDAFADVRSDRVVADIAAVRIALDELADPQRVLYPLRSLDDADATVHRRALCAPLCADVRVGGDSDAGLRILQRLWDVGVPQVVFSLPSGGPGRALVRLVERAEDLGLIAGVRARASDLHADGLLDDLARAGLDHLDLFYAGKRDHDALLGRSDYALVRSMLARASELDVFRVAVVAVTSQTFEQLETIIDELVSLDVRAAIAFALVSDTEDASHALSPSEVRQAAVTAEELADHHDIDVVWAPPLEHDPAMDAIVVVQGGPRTAGEASMRVDSDGTIFAPEGPATPAGNLLGDDWSVVWAHAAFRHYREAVDEPARCEVCPGLTLCAAGCPALPVTWARLPPGGAR
jgi:radical SAM protein with 4Fe4S-binding SPASM domain